MVKNKHICTHTLYIYINIYKHTHTHSLEYFSKTLLRKCFFWIWCYDVWENERNKSLQNDLRGFQFTKLETVWQKQIKGMKNKYNQESSRDITNLIGCMFKFLEQVKLWIIYLAHCGNLDCWFCPDPVLAFAGITRKRSLFAGSSPTCLAKVRPAQNQESGAPSWSLTGVIEAQAIGPWSDFPGALLGIQSIWIK